MGSARICVAVAEPTVEKCMAALKGVNFAEIRIDKIKERPLGEGLMKIFSSPAKLIATCRPNGLGENERKTVLLHAIEAGAAYVDVEVEAGDAYKREIIDAARAKGCKVIVSYHNYEKTPNRAELEQIADWCFESGADIAKIACMVNSEADNARLLGLLDTDRSIIVIGMGEKGKITRITAPLLGSPFTFASLSEGKETAEGQFDAKKLEKLMGGLDDG